MNEITKRTIEDYKNYLIEEEKCPVTIEKYIRDITAFVNWTEGNEVTKTLVLEYKSMLTQQYAPASVNSVLSSLNGYFNYIERYDLKVKNLKVQRQIFCQSEKELTIVGFCIVQIADKNFTLSEAKPSSLKHSTLSVAGIENTRAKNNVHHIQYERLFWMKLSLKKSEELHTMPEQRPKSSQNS